MITETRWCEDCREEVTVYGHTEGSPFQTTRGEFVVEEAPDHEDHDLSGL